MKPNMTNRVAIRGYLFSTDRLEKRVSQKGVEYIGGTINVATDEECLNVVPINFTYVTSTFKNGNANTTYQLLESIINGETKTFEVVGKDAARVRVDGDIEVNDWVNRDGEAIATRRVRGSFIHLLNANETFGNTPAHFEADMLIQSAVTMESMDGSDYMKLDGFVFNFRGDVLPISLSVASEGGMQFFENQDISTSEPYFGKVWGDIKSTVVTSTTEQDASEVGFGTPTVQTSSRTLRTWEVSGANVNLGLDDTTITMEELKAALEKRTSDLAEIRARYEARNGGGNAFGTTPTATATATPTSAAKAKAKVAVSPADFKF